jgi:hypothetical protein
MPVEQQRCCRVPNGSWRWDFATEAEQGEARRRGAETSTRGGAHAGGVARSPGGGASSGDGRGARVSVCVCVVTLSERRR